MFIESMRRKRLRIFILPLYADLIPEGSFRNMLFGHAFTNILRSYS